MVPVPLSQSTKHPNFNPICLAIPNFIHFRGGSKTWIQKASFPKQKSEGRRSPTKGSRTRRLPANNHGPPPLTRRRSSWQQKVKMNLFSPSDLQSNSLTDPHAALSVSFTESPETVFWERIFPIRQSFPRFSVRLESLWLMVMQSFSCSVSFSFCSRSLTHSSIGNGRGGEEEAKGRTDRGGATLGRKVSRRRRGVSLEP